MSWVKGDIKLPTIDDWPAPEVPDGVYTYGIIPKKEDYEKYCKAMGVEKLPIVVNVYTFDKDCSALKDGDIHDHRAYMRDFTKRNLVDLTRNSLEQPAAGSYFGKVPVLGICIYEPEYNGKVEKKDPRYAFVDGIKAAIANFNRECIKDDIHTDYKIVMTGYSAGATTAQAFSKARPDMIKLLLTGGGTSNIPLISNMCGEVYGMKDMYLEQRELWSKINKIYVRGEHEYDVLANPDGTMSKTPEDYKPSFSVNDGAGKPHVMHDMGDRGPGRPVTGSDEGLKTYNIVLEGYYLVNNPEGEFGDIYNPSIKDVTAVKYNREQGDNIALIIFEGCYHNDIEAIKVGGLKGDDVYKANTGARMLPELLGRAYEEYAVKGKMLNPEKEVEVEKEDDKGVIIINRDTDTKKESIKETSEKNFQQITGWWALDEEHQRYADMADELDL